MTIFASSDRTGFTLLELIIVAAVMGILSAVALPRLARLITSIAVHAAADDVESMLLGARNVAIARAQRASVEIDTARSRLVLRVGSDTLQTRDEARLNGVALHATGRTVTYTQLGMGFGVSNTTLIVSRGAVAETITVSRLGRVKR